MSLESNPATPPSLEFTAQETSTVVIQRRSAEYHPSIWGDYFLRYASSSNESMDFHEVEEKRIEKLKGKVKKMLLADEKPLQKLDLIDQIQRLGISYHFEIEIEKQLEGIYHEYFEPLCDEDDNNGDLYTISLLFRLLREQGHKVSCEIFCKFMDNEGKFNKSLVADTQGMLSLYEACHLRVHKEDILDEALAFTMTHLESIENQASSCFAQQAKHALKQPIRRGLTRLEARHYIPIYQEDTSHNDALLLLAKLDFNLLQERHQKELGHITRWWKDLNVTTKLPFVRDRIVECYFWILGVYFEPEFTLARKILTKVIAITSVIDDIYDVYGLLEELELFTEAIERWDISAIDGLPPYMQVCFKALLDVYDEIGMAMAEKGTSYRLLYAKEVMKRQVRGYLAEAQWFHNHKSHIPTMEEYMPIALVSSGYGLLSTISFVGMGDIVTEDAFQWLLGDPKMVKASAIVARLMDDIVSHKFEQERGHVASAMECFVKQHGVSEQEAEEELMKHVVDAWKDINKECLRPTAVPMQLLSRILNLTRVIDVLYSDEDNYTHAGGKLKDYVTSLLINPLPM